MNHTDSALLSAPPLIDSNLDLEAALKRTLATAQDRNARLLNALRLVGVTLFFGLTLLTEGGLQPGRAHHVPLGIYWVVSLGLFWGGWRSARVAHWSSLAVPLLDIPMVCLIQWGGLETSSNPRSLAVFTVGVNVFLVMLSALALKGRGIYAGAVIAVGSQWLLQTRAHDVPVGVVGGSLLILLAAGMCDLVRRRGLELMRSLALEQVRRERLGRYFSPQVAEQIQGEADALAAGTVCDVTVLFCDLRDFTQLSEKLSSSDVVALLNEHHGRMVEAVFAHGGTLDKYLGDGLMAYFGAPVRQPDHPGVALRCTLAMQAALAEMNAARATQGLPVLRMGIGLHTGKAIVGSIGAPHRREFTVVGDVVNVASRLEQLTKTLSVTILMSEETARRVGTEFNLQPLDAVQLKGRSVSTAIFTSGGLTSKCSLALEE